MSDENVGELRNEIDDGLKEAERKSSPSVESWNKRANRWANFSDIELVHIAASLGGRIGDGAETKPCPLCLELQAEIEAELDCCQKGSK